MAMHLQDNIDVSIGSWLSILQKIVQPINTTTHIKISKIQVFIPQTPSHSWDFSQLNKSLSALKKKILKYKTF